MAWSAEELAAEELRQKHAFAVEWAKSPDDPYKAAYALFPHNPNRALLAGAKWPADPDVLAHKEKLQAENNGMGLLPTKADLARSLWERAHSKLTSDEDFTKMAKLYAEIMDFVPKQAKVNVSNNSEGGKVIQVVASDLDQDL